MRTCSGTANKYWNKYFKAHDRTFEDNVIAFDGETIRGVDQTEGMIVFMR